MGLKGDLRSIPLWEILQTLSIGKKTGKLEINSEIKRAEIFFENGRIVNVRAGFIEGYDAILGLAVWDSGDFVFHPDEVTPIKTLNLDPLEAYVNLSKYVDVMNYLGDMVLLPVRIDGLALEEEVVSSSFDGVVRVRDVVLSSPLGELKTLEFIQKLLREGKLIRVEEDLRIFWMYIFWRYLRFLTMEEGRKYLGDEKGLRKELKNFVSETAEGGILEDLIFSEKISWHYFYRHINRFSESDVELIIRDVFDILNKYVKSSLDRTQSEQFSVILKSKGNNIFVQVCRDLKSDEFIVSLFFNGEKTLKQVFEFSPLSKIETQRLILKLITGNCLIDVREDSKMELIYLFFVFWRNLLKELNKYNLEEELLEAWNSCIENSFLDIRYLFNNIVVDKIPNFVYCYKEREKFTEEEIKGFIKNIIEVIYQNLEKKISRKDLENIFYGILEELVTKANSGKEFFKLIVE